MAHRAIEVVDLPIILMSGFSSYVNVYQRVCQKWIQEHLQDKSP